MDQSENKEIKITEHNIWQYFEKLPNFLAKCKDCGHSVRYLRLGDNSSGLGGWIKCHLKKKHKEDVKAKAEEYFRVNPERYYYSEHKMCLICWDMNIQFFEDHLVTHYSHELYTYEISNRYNEYYSELANKDFTVQCIFHETNCEGTKTGFLDYTSLQRHFLSNYHTDEKAAHLKQVEGTKTHAVPLTSNYELMRNFETSWNTKAKCKGEKCRFEADYIKIKNFIDHMNEKHKKTSSFEIEVAAIGFPFVHFKYCEEGEYQGEDILQCIHCHEYLLNDHNVAVAHVARHIERREESIEWEIFDRRDLKENEWLWKYCKKSNDFDEVKCDICHSTIKLDDDLSDLNNHMKRVHLNNPTSSRKPDEDDIAGSSGSQPKRAKK